VIIDRMVKARIRMEAGTKVTEITEKGVRIVRKGKYREFFEADSVVAAVGMRAVDSLACELEGKVPLVIRVGDCMRPGDIRDAIEGGFLAGNGI
jgi:NADPH-dependent 2,4-dienoyl-CoA reductase/sulfur reductase-like enzyme